MKPGIISALPMEAYLALPAVSASLLKTIITECPRKAWFKSWLNPDGKIDDPTKATDTGSVAHMILLEGHSDGVETIDPNDHPAEKTGNIPDGWTNKSIREARDNAIADGKIPMLKDAMINVEAMVQEARRFLDEEVRIQEPAVWSLFQPDGGESESTCIWQDGPTLCRIRPDRISADRKVIGDYKTTKRSAEPDQWGRTQLVGMGYYVSAAFYRRGILAQCGVQPEYFYLVQEQDAPYLCSLSGIDPQKWEIGKSKIEYALRLWQQCVETNAWPGYPARIVYPETPPWELARWQEQEETALGNEYDIEAIGWSKESKE